MTTQTAEVINLSDGVEMPAFGLGGSLGAGPTIGSCR